MSKSAMIESDALNQQKVHSFESFRFLERALLDIFRIPQPNALSAHRIDSSFTLSGALAIESPADECWVRAVAALPPQTAMVRFVGTVGGGEASDIALDECAPRLDLT